MCSVTSNSFWAMLLAETLIWMLIAGCCCCGCSDVGAFGFSNDRSLVYCASTLSWGGAPSCGAPLLLVMKILLERAGGLRTVSGHIPLMRLRKCPDRREWLSWARTPRQGGAWRLARAISAEAAGSGPFGFRNYRKLLKMRDFRSRSCFPLRPKGATIAAPKRAIGRAQFHAYILETHSVT